MLFYIILLEGDMTGMTRKNLIFALIVLAANLFVYRGVTGFSIVNLDEQQLFTGKWQQLLGDDSVAEAFRQNVFEFGRGTFYRPALTLSFIADARRSGKEFSAAIFHKTNLLLHSANAVLAFALFAALGYAPELAAFGALVFSLHPAISGVVGWIPGRNDSILFFAAAMSLLLLTAAIKRRNPVLFVGHLFFFFLALITKETAVGLPALFPAWAFLAGWRRPAKAALLPAAGWLICLIFYAVLRSSAVNAGFQLPDPAELLSRMSAYSSVLFFPLKIPVYAWFNNINVTRALLVNAAGLLLVATAWYRTKSWVFPVSMAAVYLFIFPSAVSDRFIPHRVYLPAFFMALASIECAALVYTANRKKTLLTAAIIVVGLGFLAHRSLHRFNGAEAFWSSVNDLSPSSSEAAYELGYVAHLRGDIPLAEKYYILALQRNPAAPDVRNNLAIIRKQAGRFNEAMRLYQEELTLEPGKALVLGNMGSMLAAQGKFATAASYYRQAAAAEPSRKTYENLIFCLLKTGRSKEAEEYSRRLLQLEK